MMCGMHGLTLAVKVNRWRMHTEATPDCAEKYFPISLKGNVGARACGLLPFAKMEVCTDRSKVAS